MRKSLLIAIVALSAIALPATASASSRPWKTDEQAARYLETRLPSWAGIDLMAVDYKSAFCINGAYSDYERRTGRHYGDRTDKNGEYRFRTFSCTLHVDEHDFNLYVQTRAPGPWRVTVDR